MTLQLAFSTLGCPSWTIERVGEAAREYGYAGVEVRLLDGEILPHDLDSDGRARIKRALAGLAIPCVDTSVRFNYADPAVRAQNRADAVRYLELANQLESPLIRVFCGQPDDGATAATAVERLSESLAELAPVAERHGVGIALETHDAMSAGRTVADVLAGVPARSIGALWDSHHPYRMGETPEETLGLLADRLLLTHVKDARRAGDGWQLVLLGEGEVPVREMLIALHRHGWSGWVSVEWEKKWHPEIPDPEVALPQHASLLREYLAAAGD